MKIHLDLDSFFISAERIKNPALKNIPAAVGGRGDPFIFDSKEQSKISLLQKGQGAFIPSVFYNSDTTFENYFVEGSKIRGIVITASYEARKYGIKTGVSIREALSLCPHLVVVPPNHLYYHELSTKLYKFLQKCIPVVEQFSIDEFFGDLSGYIKDEEVEKFLQNLQKEIMERFALPISIGAAQSKWTAKLATSFAKPQGVKVVREVEPFIKDIPIEKFPGIGRGYLRRLRNYGIQTLGQTKEIQDIFQSWKLPGQILYKRIWGIDEEQVESGTVRKSIGISRTIDPISDREEIRRRIIILARHLATSVAKIGFEPRFYGLSIRYEQGIRSKAHRLLHSRCNEMLIKNVMLELFEECDRFPTQSIVRLSIRCANEQKKKTYNLLDHQKDERFAKLTDSALKIRSKYGMDSLKWGIELYSK